MADEYPPDEVDQRIQDILREAGLSDGYTVIFQGRVELSRDDIYVDDFDLDDSIIRDRGPMTQPEIARMFDEIDSLPEII